MVIRSLRAYTKSGGGSIQRVIESTNKRESVWCAHVVQAANNSRLSVVTCSYLYK